MTAFRFPLEKVLEWRCTALAAEEAKFKQQAAIVAGVERARAALEAAGAGAESAVREWGEVSGRDLAALDDFRRHIRNRQAQVAAARAQAQKELDARQAAMLEARRRVRLLERLKERRLAEWKVAFDRELEQIAGESHLARVAAERGRMERVERAKRKNAGMAG